MSPTQDSGPQAQPTNFPHEKSHPSQVQKLVMESVALPSFSVTGSCVTLLCIIKCLHVFKCLSPTDFRGEQDPHSFEDLSLCPSGLYLVKQGGKKKKLWYNRVQPYGDQATN